MRSIEAAVDHAIFNSVVFNKIVFLPWSEEGADLLRKQCDDTVDAGHVVEYWGTARSDDPLAVRKDNEWRVHLRFEANEGRGKPASRPCGAC